MSEPMSHRERVHASLAHREPDRVPIGFCSSTCTAIHKDGCERLRQHLGMGGEPEFIHRSQQIVDVGEEIKRRFDIDFRGIFLGGGDKGGDIELGEGRHKDKWGVIRTKPPSSLYYDVEESPLAGEITLGDIVRCPWLDPDDPGLTRGLRERIKKIREGTDYALLLNVPSAFVHASQYLRGFEDWWMIVLAIIKSWKLFLMPYSRSIWPFAKMPCGPLGNRSM